MEFGFVRLHNKTKDRLIREKYEKMKLFHRPDGYPHFLFRGGIVVTVFLTEFRGGNVVFVSDRVDQFVCKFLGCHVQNLCARVIFQDEVGDGMH